MKHSTVSLMHGLPAVLPRSTLCLSKAGPTQESSHTQGLTPSFLPRGCWDSGCHVAGPSGTGSSFVTSWQAGAEGSPDVSPGPGPGHICCWSSSSRQHHCPHFLLLAGGYFCLCQPPVTWAALSFGTPHCNSLQTLQAQVGSQSSMPLHLHHQIARGLGDRSMLPWLL